MVPHQQVASSPAFLLLDRSPGGRVHQPPPPSPRPSVPSPVSFEPPGSGRRELRGGRSPQRMRAGCRFCGSPAKKLRKGPSLRRTASKRVSPGSKHAPQSFLRSETKTARQEGSRCRSVGGAAAQCPEWPKFITDHAEPRLLSSDLSLGCSFDVCNIYYFLHLGKGPCGIL